MSHQLILMRRSIKGSSLIDTYSRVINISYPINWILPPIYDTALKHQSNRTRGRTEERKKTKSFFGIATTWLLAFPSLPAPQTLPQPFFFFFFFGGYLRSHDPSRSNQVVSSDSLCLASFLMLFKTLTGVLTGSHLYSYSPPLRVYSFVGK